MLVLFRDHVSGFLASVCRGAADVGDAAVSAGKCCSSSTFIVLPFRQRNSGLTYHYVY